MTIERAPGTEPENQIELRGVAVSPPRGWEVRIRRWSPSEEGDPMPVLHASTVPLVPDRGDYGSAVVEQLGPEDVFVSLVEFTPDEANTELFAPIEDLPRSLDAALFDPKKLQRVIPGQAGQQVFFSHNDRAFCLYVVIGSAALKDQLARRAEEALGRIALTDPEGGEDPSAPEGGRARLIIQ